MNCLTLLALDLDSSSKAVQFTNFRKVGQCGKQKDGDYICTFQMGMSMASSYMQGLLGDFMAAGEIIDGRFLKDEGVWIFLPIGS